jgi:Lipid A core - O-antigen ligase and related enzymes
MSHDMKYPRGVSAGPSRSAVRRERFEIAVVAHVAVLVLLASWWLGGNTQSARLALSLWGSLGFVLTAIGIFARRSLRTDLQPLRWLWPFGLFATMVAISAFNPSYREVLNDHQTLYVESQSVPGWPSTARPVHSLLTLWFFSAAYLSAFNLLVFVRHRRYLRALVFTLVANGLVLAIFGTLQKLMNAPSTFFGLGPPIQPKFFASFLYHNHWGAFTLLMTALALGAIYHFARRSHARNIWHSPVLGGVVAILFLAATVPLSASRSSTILMIVLVAVGFVHWLRNVIKTRRAAGVSAAPAVAGGVFAAISVIGFSLYIAQPVIEQRFTQTLQQIEEARSETSLNFRLILYRDTWNTAREKLWFGWGMGSYPTVFFTRNTQRFASPDGLQVHFHDAHSDWLQSAAEVGLVGTFLLGLCALVPLAAARAPSLAPLVAYPFFGCGLVVFYACLEFPFGNRAVICAWWATFFAGLQYARIRAREGAAPRSRETTA